MPQLKCPAIEMSDDTDLVAEAQAAQEKLDRHRQFIYAHELLATLPIKYQEVLTLRFVQGKKIAEIATILNKREGTVKSLISRALAKIRAQMQPKQPEGIVVAEGYKKP